ncbi:MAG TPA: regulatory protein GemA [Spirochaetales bacterium]|nr:regulatory protein GemA [Spirochaetales bacterium]
MTSALRNRTERLALIHLARKDRGLDEYAYHALLAGAAGVESAAAIETEAQFEEVMRAFANLGFRRKPSTRKRMPVKPEQQGNYCSAKQLYYIKGLWELASRAKDEKSLRAMVKRISKVDELRFLLKGEASKVILALRDICWKAGINPDGPAPRPTDACIHNPDGART